MTARFDPGPRTLAAIGAVSLLLLLGSFLVDGRVVVSHPRFVDVGLWTLWRLALGTATIGSFLVAVYRLAASRQGDAARGLEIRGYNHDIDVHLHGEEVASRIEWTDKSEGPAGGEDAEDELDRR